MTVKSEVVYAVNANNESPGHGYGLWASDEDMVERAKTASDIEHSMSISECIRTYKRAIFWTVIVTLSTTMESYDLQLIGSFYGYPIFQKKYGQLYSNGQYQIPANWQVALSVGSNVGIIIGIFANGFIIDKFGHRILLILAHLFLTAFIFISFFANSIQVLFAGELICGLTFGIFNTIAPLYAVEVCPTKLRAYMATYVNLNWVIGHLIAAGVLDGLVSNTTEWSYRLPFAIQWVWPLPLAVLIFLAPDSPWWLVRKGRLNDAEKAVKRLCKKDSAVDASNLVAMINHTYLVEQEIEVGTSFIDCFKGVDARRTEIASIVWLSQGLVGFVVQGYNTYFFELAGLPASDAYKLTLGSFAIAFTGTVLCGGLLTLFGRRTIYLSGLIVMIPLLFTIGFLALGPSSDVKIRWAQSVILLLWFAAYGLTIGPVPYVICSEISSSKLRTKTISIARGLYYCISIVGTVAGPYMLNPNNGNLKGKAAFPGAACCVVLLIWSYFRLPESKNRTFAELDLLFAHRVSARKFKGTFIDVYATEDIKTEA